MRPEGWHLVIIIVLALVLFGAPRLPGIARSVGQSLRIFRSEVRQLKEEGDPGHVAADPGRATVIDEPVPSGPLSPDGTPSRRPVGPMPQ